MERKLVGKWKITMAAIGSSTGGVFQGATDVTVYTDGPWISFKDANGAKLLTNRNVILEADAGRMGPGGKE